MEQTFRSDICDPQTTTPGRAVGSIRRTSHIDIGFEADGEIVLHGTARDLLTAEDIDVLGTGRIEARLTASHVLQGLGVDRGGAASEVVSDPALGHAVAALLGSTVGGGFRARLSATLPAESEAGTPLFLLLDELPVAALISGYALMYRGALGDRLDAEAMKSDICAGWRSDGHMITSIRRSGRMPTPVGPAAPDLMPADDPLAWHEIAPLPAGGMRRRRLIDLVDGPEPTVVAMFRDTHVGEDGVEAVLHEYSLTARIDERHGVLHDCVARPQVLPWNECPAAAASAGRLDGLPLDAIRDLVRRELRGTATCTHLNDLLRSLGDLAVLLPMLRTGRPPVRPARN